ncbi:MAG: cohesin domain-containing protein [Candidatus Acidiferrales bacterium]
MKYKRAVIAVVFAALAALLLPGLSFADGVAVNVVSPATVSQGDAFTVDANIENATDIFDFQLDLNFDPAVLQADGVLEGTFLSGGGDTFCIPGVVDNTGGSITFNADTLLSAISGVDGGGMLLQIDFNALATGDEFAGHRKPHTAGFAGRSGGRLDNEWLRDSRKRNCPNARAEFFHSSRARRCALRYASLAAPRRGALSRIGVVTAGARLEDVVIYGDAAAREAV